MYIVISSFSRIKKLFLTLSAVLKDERQMIISITETGLAMRQKALKVPYAIACQLSKDDELFTTKEVALLKEQLYKIIQTLA